MQIKSKIVFAVFICCITCGCKRSIGVSGAGGLVDSELPPIEFSLLLCEELHKKGFNISNLSEIESTPFNIDDYDFPLNIDDYDFPHYNRIEIHFQKQVGNFLRDNNCNGVISICWLEWIYNRVYEVNFSYHLSRSVSCNTISEISEQLRQIIFRKSPALHTGQPESK